LYNIDPAVLQWGVAYELAGTEEEQQQYIAYLEWREKQYDIRKLCDVHVAGDIGSSSSSSSSGSMAGRQQFSAVIPNCLVYIASHSANNQNYLGPAPLDRIAQQIAAARVSSCCKYRSTSLCWRALSGITRVHA
jgi:cation transport regulator ChaC